MGPSLKLMVDEADRRSDDPEPGILREALAIGDVGFWSWNTLTDSFSADTVARRLWSLPENEPISLSAVRSAIHPGDIRDIHAAALITRDTGAELHVTFRLTAPDGELRWMRVRARPSETLGSPVVLGVTIDVTERKRVEEALRETESRLDRAQELGGAIPFECDHVTDRILASKGFKALIGLQPHEPLNNRTLLSRVHPNDRAKLEGEIALCASQAGPRESTFRVILPDDSTRWILWRGESLEDPAKGIVGFAGVMLDITSRRETEDELRLSRSEASARFRELEAIYQHAPVGLAVLDRDFCYVRVNDFLAEMNGFAREQMLGRCIFDILPDIRIRESYMRQVLITGEPVRDVEVETVNPRDPHTKLAFKIHYYPLPDERGAVVGVGVIAENVTPQRRAEKARELLSRELSHRIKNLFAVISGIIALSARGDNALAVFARAVRGRIEALAQAHDLVRPDLDRDATREPPTFQSLLRLLLAPYAPDSWRSQRITITGADPRIGSGAATAISLALHEFATNAAKYGSLSNETGRLTIDCSLTESGLDILWRERGGPPVSGEPKLTGFGSLLARRSLVDDLGGAVELDWEREGLTLRIKLPHNALSR